ncbi:MAG: Mu transposase C-terminal domain-containing protein [Paraglaciecola sp.]|uniref:Mu transposase C-terminal domain-containing protein n=1 Tax=Alishewanella sp. HL-SH05 TaxID=3461145 RepID=UPI00274C8F4E|nr:Mu transposase C-terminal domain-containing protein [Paraglaciecola sp.]
MSNLIDLLYDIPVDVTHNPEQELRRAEQRKSLNSVKNIENLDAYQPKVQDVIIFRLNVIEFCEKRCGKISHGTLKKISLEIIEKFGDNSPSTQTIFKWHKRYIDSGKKISALAPSTKKSGNRKSRYPQIIESYIQDSLKLIKDAEQGAVSSAHSHLCNLIFNYNKENPETKITPPSIQAFWNRYRKLTPLEREINKFGVFAAKKKFKHISTIIETKRALERVEIDHTKLDIFLIDSETKKTLGRPWITSLCDVHTRSLVGFYLGFTPPSYASVARAIKHTLLSKDYVQKIYSDIKNPWICHGKPELIVADNGKEFDANDLKLSLNALLINFGKNPVATPYLKPIIERYFGVLNTQLLRKSPGHTLAANIGNQDYDPAKHAVLDMKAFLHIFHIWICDIYQVKSDARKTRVPNMSWNESLEENEPRPVDYDPEILDLVFCLNKEGKLTREGITFRYLKYSNDATAELFGRYGSHKVIYKVDPDFLGHIFVLNKAEDKFFRVECKNYDYASKVTLHQHNHHLKVTTQAVDSYVSADDIAEATNRIYEIIDESKRSKKISVTSKQARLAEDSKLALLKSALYNNNVDESEIKETDLSDEEIDLSDWKIL